MATHKKADYVLITGGSMGIGFELARCFASAGYNLVLVSRTEKDLKSAAAEIKKEFKVEVLIIVKDLFLTQNAFDLYDEVKALKINPYILVNNAAQGQYGEFSDTDITRELEIINLNIASVVVLTKLFLKDMLHRRKGGILNVSSVASRIPGPLQSVYHATKAFVQSFTAAIRDEVKDTGITITALLPGPTDTDFFSKADMLNAKNVVKGDLADPAKVALDGYIAFIKGVDNVVSGTMNKMEVAISSIMPESMVAEMVHNQQAPVNKKTKSKK
ncbi:MAG: SDR family oxidoreductase [Bacteroidia bacterium]|nr:SDR family oxidoreductase [Bacteroidia bacterium]